MFWMFQCNNNRKRYRTKTYKGKQFQCNNSTLPCFFEIWSKGSPFLWLWILITNGWVIFQTQVRPIFHIHWKPWIRNRWPATIHSTWDNPTFQIARMHWNWSCWIWRAYLLGTPTTGFELYTNICGTLLLRVFFCCWFFLLLVMVEEKYLGLATGYYGTGYCTVYAG